MTKTLAFISLLFIALMAAIIGSQNGHDFFSELWSQIFWLAIGTMATVFILESILENAELKQNISKDAFAFRIFSAKMLDAISQMVNSDQDGNDLFETALEGDNQFSLEANKLIASINRSNHFSPEIYQKYYLDLGNGLRDLSKNYIRLFSTNKKEMLSNYKILTNTASRWCYMDEFSEGARNYRNSLDSEDENKQQRENSFQQSVDSAKETISETSKIIAELVSNSAAGKRCY